MVNKRAGFTLFELMLVMAIILVAAAISIPAIDAIMSDGSLKAARDVVRARWADIRGRAMKEGRPYKFSVIDQSKKFKIEPEDSNAPSDSDEPPIIYEGELPGDIVFTKDPTTTGSASSGGSDYVSRAVYLPDGTARDDVQVLFGKSGARPIGLQLRAVTGAVTMIDKTENKP